MSRRSLYPQTARHIPIRDDDWSYLSQMFDRTGGVHRIGVSIAIRSIIHAYVERLRANAENAIDLKDA